MPVYKLEPIEGTEGHTDWWASSIPSPVTYIGSHTAYATALYAALSQLALPNSSYEFNAALVRVLDMPDAEHRWLAGEHIFAGVLREPATPRVYADRIDFVRREAFGG